MEVRVSRSVHLLVVDGFGRVDMRIHELKQIRLVLPGTLGNFKQGHIKMSYNTDPTISALGVPTRARLREYPVDHVWQGSWQQRALADQLDFLAGSRFVAFAGSTANRPGRQYRGTQTPKNQ
jgi:hypothetical protein